MPASAAHGRSAAVDRAISALARRQHGVWSRKQALAAGASPTMIRRRVQSKLWLPQDTAVYAHAATGPSWERSVMAAILAEPAAIASHQTAAVLHGLDGFRPGRPHVAIPPGANARGKLSIAHRRSDAPATRVDRIPVTSLVQTFVDLSQTFSVKRVGGALQSAALRRPHLIDALQDRYLELAPRGGRNLRRLRQMLEAFDRETVAESQLEVVLQEVLTHPEIPPVLWQAPFPGRAPGAGRVDGLIPAWSLVVEGDGRAWHARVDDFERDRQRDAEAAAAGLQTLRFTWRQLRHSPDWVRRVTIAAGTHRASQAS